DRILRRLQAFLVVADREAAFLLSGSGDVISPDEDGLLGVGSGAPYALAAARALVRHADLDAPALAEAAMKIAAGICVYTNDEITVEALGCPSACPPPPTSCTPWPASPRARS